MEFLEWIENDLDSENQHSTAVQEKNLEHEDAVRDVHVQITQTHQRHRKRKKKMKLV